MDADSPRIAPCGFREYDARWLYEAEVDLAGIRAVGCAFGTLLTERRGAGADIITGHDFRCYSEEVHNALNSGLVAAGCTVHDIGLALTPMAYFAQFALDVPAVAMVTASHNENGWTGVKMGFDPPFTFEPKEMAALKFTALNRAWRERAGGRLKKIFDVKDRYVADLAKAGKLDRRLKIVIACGNGTAGAFAPDLYERLGAQVVPLHCELDHTFPHHNPDPEDLSMLKSVAEAVLMSGADAGLAFDGDGDRCGLVDNEGNIIFADKAGLILARELSGDHRGAKFVADIKSTGLFCDDPVLEANGAQTEFWKTGHSHLKRRIAETGAIAGFERSGHFFFREPYGRGYDDGLLAGVMICRAIAGSKATLAELYRTLPTSWASPAIGFRCSDDAKYQVVEALASQIVEMRRSEDVFAGRRIVDCTRICGIRFLLDDQSWGLIRASSNKPELVAVCESRVSEKAMSEVSSAIAQLLSQYCEVGERSR